MQLVPIEHVVQLAQGSGAYHNQQLDDMISVELEGRSKAPLNNVGLVVWQSAFVLADYLIARPPFRTWRDVSVIELGSGTGQGSFCLKPLASNHHSCLTARAYIGLQSMGAAPFSQ